MPKINGQERPELIGLTLAELLMAEGYDRQLVACECNRCIVPRSDFETHVIGVDEVVEIVRFVGGG